MMAGEGAQQTKPSWGFFTFPPACLPPNPIQPRPLHCGCFSITHLLAFRVPTVKLLCFSFALNNRISCFQVRRICHQGKGNVPVGDAVNPTVVHSQVVLHITRALMDRRGESPPGT